MRIGSLQLTGNVVLAPMAGISDPPFRRLVQGFGVSALWTEMISAEGLLKVPHRFATVELAGHTVPTIFQLYGTDPAAMAAAALRAQEPGAAGVDMNMGCPARKIVHKGAGAALMNQPVLAAAIVAAIRKAIHIPLTAKIRAGWDERNRNAPAFARMLEREGVDCIILHSRSRSSRHSGPPSLELLKEVKDSALVPVIGNGGITSVQDALDMIEETGCDGVMIGRGALGRPWLPAWIIGRIDGSNNRPADATMIRDVVRTHFDDQLKTNGTLTGVRRMRKHLVWYSRGLQRGAEFRRQVLTVEDPDRVLSLIDHWFDGVELV